jgi:hypothetical protein
MARKAGHSLEKSRVARLTPFRFGDPKHLRAKPASLTFPPDVSQASDQLRSGRELS